VPKPTFEEGNDDVLRKSKQPPLDQDKAAGEVVRVLDLQSSRVVSDRLEGERRVAVGAERAVGTPRQPALR
jgi:hypothetical protein